MKKKLAIVGIFFNGYYDLWEDFLELFRSKWPDCPYPFYIVDNVRELEFERQYDVTVLHAGADAEYSKKVQTALEQIDADYYLLLLEDFFFEKRIEADPLEAVMRRITQNGLNYFRMPIPEFLAGVKPDRRLFDEATQAYRIPTSSEYTVSCQPSIWEKGFLQKCIGTGNYNAWVFEGIYSRSTDAHTDAFLKYCRVDYTNLLGLRHGAVQGKFLPNVYRDFADQGYRFKSDRQIMDAAAFKKHRLKQKTKQMIPLSAQKLLKKYMKSGSVVDQYQKQIAEEMLSLGIK